MQLGEEIVEITKQAKIKEAENKFGIIIHDFTTRENLKKLAEITGIIDFKILSHWSRSIINSNYNLQHPNYMEYREHYQVGDVNWLIKGFTCVDMNEYLQWKKKRTKEE